MRKIEDLKIAVLGAIDTLVRIKFTLDNERVQPVFFENGDQALSRIGAEDFDLLLVDSLHKEADRICRSAHSSRHTPIALLIPNKNSNWAEIGNWEVDAFIFEEIGRLELLARLNAVARRPARRLCLPSS